MNAGYNNHNHSTAPRWLGPALLVAGVLCFASGLDVSNPFGPDVARLFELSSGDLSLARSLIGMVAMLVGLILSSRQSH